MKASVPLIDLHCHLDGSITVEIAKKLAAIQNIDLPYSDGELLERLSVPPSCENLTQFLECFALPCSLMQTEKSLEEAVFLVLENLRSQNLVYAEIRFAPQKHLEKGMTQKQAVEAALKGMKRSSLKSNLILCLMRGDDTFGLNMETLKTAQEFLVSDGGVTAVDLAGAEALFPTENFGREFEYARKNKIPFTIHAGEAAGAESIKCALDFGAERIGHGVTLGDDEKLLEFAVENKIPLEMAPSSNRQTKAVLDMKNYPLKKYLECGVCVTVNTDDMAICRTDLKSEFEYLEKNYGISPSDEKKMLLNAAGAAFTDDKTKAELKKIIESASF